MCVCVCTGIILTFSFLEMPKGPIIKSPPIIAYSSGIYTALDLSPHTCIPTRLAIWPHADYPPTIAYTPTYIVIRPTYQPSGPIGRPACWRLGPTPALLLPPPLPNTLVAHSLVRSLKVSSLRGARPLPYSGPLFWLCSCEALVRLCEALLRLW